jgi:glycosyltransferase involved in cell wall biosynthesis
VSWRDLPPQRARRIGFASTRFHGTDGVSLEAAKWAAVLEGLGHACFYLAGASDRPADRSRVVPEALFTHPDVRAIYDAAFASDRRPPESTRAIHRLTAHLKSAVEAFLDDFGIELLILENAVTIPMNIPLGLALTEVLAERGLPAIAHHHDFPWERQRYLRNAVGDYLAMAFPPRLPSIHHVVISSLAASQLSLRTGNSAMLIPNVMDFAAPLAALDDYTDDLRADLGLQPEERLLLQPTRVVQRKGIEHAIELARRLERPVRLVISHASGDERDDYEGRLREYAGMLRVPVNFVSELIQERRGRTADGRKVYALADVYHHADLVTYPSTIEGFGNAFLEAIYFRRPVVVNNYSIYELDIKPKGFRVIEFDGYITQATLHHARQVLDDPSLAQAMVEHNAALGLRYFSYDVLARHLTTLLADCFGEEV